MTQMSLTPTEVPATKRVVVQLSDLPSVSVGPPPREALVESIRVWGLKEPVQLAPYRGGYVVLTGRRRIAALRKLYEQTGDERFAAVPAEVTEIENTSQRAALTIALHATREDNVAAELDAIEQLTEKGASEKDIYAATGLSVQTIRHHLKLISKLIPEVREMLEESKVAPSVADQVAKLSADTQRRLVSECGGRIKAKDVEEIRRVSKDQILGQMPDSIFGGGDAVESEREMLIRSIRGTLDKILAVVDDKRLAGIDEDLKNVLSTVAATNGETASGAISAGI